MKLLPLLLLLVGCSPPTPLPKPVAKTCHRYLVGFKGTTLVWEADDVQHDGGKPKLVKPDGTPFDVGEMGDRLAVIDRGAHFCDKPGTW